MSSFNEGFLSLMHYPNNHFFPWIRESQSENKHTIFTIGIAESR